MNFELITKTSSSCAPSQSINQTRKRPTNQPTNQPINQPVDLNAIFPQFVVVFVAKLYDERDDDLEMLADSMPRLTRDGAETLNVSPRRRHGRILLKLFNQKLDQVHE